MEILILCGIYLAELLCYQMGIRILFQTRQKTWKWMAAGILAPVAVGFLSVDMAGKNVLVSFSVVCVMFVSLEGRMKDKGAQLTLMYILLICIEDVLAFLYKQIDFFGDSHYVENLNYLGIKCWTAVSLFVLKWVRKKIMWNKKTHINSVIYFILGIIVVSMMFCLAVLNQVSIYVPNKKFDILCNILNIAIVFSIFFLVVFILYIKAANERMEQLLQTEHLLKESQINYYKQVLKKETDTRRYRHDMNGHLIYLLELLKIHKIDEAQKYLIQILGGFKKIQRTYHIVGNELVEIVMNYFFGMLPEDTEIKIIGKCPVKIDMEDTEICTVFSNVLQNTVEEIIENKIYNAKIIIKVQKGKEYVQYNIKNSLISKIDKNNVRNNEFPQSRRADKRNHGIGMINVKEAVERNHGKFEWYLEKGLFCVNIILPIKE